MGTRRSGPGLTSLMVEVNCSEHGTERYRVKIIKKYNIKHEEITAKFRTRPRHELSSIVIGKSISYETAREYLEQYLSQSIGLASITSIRLMK